MKWLKKVAATPLTSIARVIDSLEAITNDRTNAPSIHSVREAVNNNWLTIYPVGSIYMNVNNVDPSLLFGGTWTQIKDKFLLSSGDIYNNGATGGTSEHNYTPSGTVGNHTLTLAEMPAHDHGIKAGIGNVTTGTAEVLIPTNVYSGGFINGVGDSQPHNHGFSGVATKFDNMPPYLAVNVWVRTA